ncbi:MAG: acyl-CoA thioesterase [Deltaproteobacteria bacterium]|nr:acyl-CoA thioesterase [Deltaproteobacteria bacterium]
MNELVFPQHTNAYGSVFGGQVMWWIDMCAGICAQRHCSRVVVTASVDDLVFESPLRVGECVHLVSRVNAAFRTSVEVEVTVEGEDLATRERRPCVQARMTFVALDDDGKPREVPGLLLQTDEERARAAAAAERRRGRLTRRR